MTLRYAIVDFKNQSLSNASNGLIATVLGAAFNPLSQLGLAPSKSNRIYVTVKGSVAFAPQYKRNTDQYYPLGYAATNPPSVLPLQPFTFEAVVTANDTAFDVFPGTTGTYSLTVEIDADS
ncbi:MAG: hypothetical protein ABR999_10915 [Methanoregula sp.]|jgi:hypothetical protein|uniref:hypothetical protein n=1 Tax=Methanoregula sp. TaxID=2052170 RepID=UPI003D0B4349